MLDADSEKPVIELNTFLVESTPSERERSPSIFLLEESSDISTKPSKDISRKEPLTLGLGDSNSDGKSPYQPIVIPSSPIKEPSATYPELNNPIHAFFQPKLKIATSHIPRAPTKRLSTVQPTHVAPYPTIQHTRGPQTSSPDIPVTVFPRRTAPRPTLPLHEPASYEFLNQPTNVENEPGNVWSYFTPSKNGHGSNNTSSSPPILD